MPSPICPLAPSAPPLPVPPRPGFPPPLPSARAARRSAQLGRGARVRRALAAAAVAVAVAATALNGGRLVPVARAAAADPSPPASTPAAVPPPPVPGTSPGGPANPPPAPAAGAPPAAAAAPPPAPVPVDPRALLDGLNPDELQEAIKLMRSFYVNPGEVDDRAIARATLTGFLNRLGSGATLVPVRPALDPKTAPPAAAPRPGGGGGGPTPGPARDETVPGDFLGELLPNGLGYVRLGALTKEHLAGLDRSLKSFLSAGANGTGPAAAPNGSSVAPAGARALVLDLRATAATSGEGYDLAAEVLRRFVPKGRMLFTLKKSVPGGNTQDRLFTTNADPAATARLFVVVDADTAGAGEVIAAVLRREVQALLVGSPTAGQAVEYADFGLSGNAGAMLRLAVSQAVLPPNDAKLFPVGAKPDLAVAMSRADKCEIFRQSTQRQPPGTMAPFVYDAERLHFNEAALVAGTNPELDAARDAQERRREGLPAPRPIPRDAVLQRAVDWETALEAVP